MNSASGEITATLTAEDIEHLMCSGTSTVRVSDGPVSVYVRCEDTLTFEVSVSE